MCLGGLCVSWGHEMGGRTLPTNGIGALGESEREGTNGLVRVVIGPI